MSNTEPRTAARDILMTWLRAWDTPDADELADQILIGFGAAGLTIAPDEPGRVEIPLLTAKVIEGFLRRWAGEKSSLGFAWETVVNAIAAAELAATGGA